MGFISSTHGEMMHLFTHLKGRLGGQNVAANLVVTDLICYLSYKLGFALI